MKNKETFSFAASVIFFSVVLVDAEGVEFNTVTIGNEKENDSTLKGLEFVFDATGGLATGLRCFAASAAKQRKPVARPPVASNTNSDPFRVESFSFSFPVALPPAIEFDAFGVNQNDAENV